MSSIVCKNGNCKYKSSSDFCTKELVVLNYFGSCVHWWERERPQMRPGMWDYAEVPLEDPKTEPMDATEHERRIERNIEGEASEDNGK